MDGNKIAILKKYTTSLFKIDDVLRTVSKFEFEGMLYDKAAIANKT